jgi:hypothetical protein
VKLLTFHFSEWQPFNTESHDEIFVNFSRKFETKNAVSSGWYFVRAMGKTQQLKKNLFPVMTTKPSGSESGEKKRHPHQRRHPLLLTPLAVHPDFTRRATVLVDVAVVVPSPMRSEVAHRGPHPPHRSRIHKRPIPFANRESFFERLRESAGFRFFMGKAFHIAI